MALSPHDAALAVLCRPNGILIEALYDELGLTPDWAPGSAFATIVAAAGSRKAARFLRVVVASHCALDWELDVTLPHGMAPLFFSGCMTHRGIVVIGTKAPLAAAIPKSLARQAGRFRDTLEPALAELGSRREAKAKSGRRLRTQLSRLSKALVAAERDSRNSHGVRKGKTEHTHLLEIAAHDLRNPASGILAASQYLMEDAAALLDEQHMTLLRSIESSSSLILRLIAELFETPEAGAGKTRLNYQSTNPALLLEQSAATNRPLAESRNVRVQVKVDANVPRLDLDPLKITQAMNALLTNVISGSQSGSRIEVHVAARGEKAIITVHDEAPGQADDPKGGSALARGSRSGRGLQEARAALTLGRVKRIVEGHHGEIRMESDPRKASKFTLTLPIRACAAAKDDSGGEPRRRRKKASRPESTMHGG